MIQDRTELLAPMGGMQFSHDATTTLTTNGLGSCVALALYDPEKKVGGLVHCVLPLSTTGNCDEEAFPCMFVDSGITALLRAVVALGARKSRLHAYAAGAGELLEMQVPFRIGHRNRVVLRRILDKNEVELVGADLGGNAARAMSLNLANGRVNVRRNGLNIEL